LSPDTDDPFQILLTKVSNLRGTKVVKQDILRQGLSYSEASS